MTKENYDFGTLTIAENFIIGEVKEGYNLSSSEYTSTILKRGYELFQGEAWGYISNRVNSYSLQPMAHANFDPNDYNFIAYAVVFSPKNTGRFFELEEKFVNNRYPFRCFNHLSEAIMWIRSTLEERD